MPEISLAHLDNLEAHNPERDGLGLPLDPMAPGRMAVEEDTVIRQPLKALGLPVVVGDLSGALKIGVSRETDRRDLMRVTADVARQRIPGVDQHSGLEVRRVLRLPVTTGDRLRAGEERRRSPAKG